MSSFKIGIISDWLKLPFEKSMEVSAKLGAHGVQIYAVEGDMAPENMSSGDIAEKNSIIRENGLVVSALCGDLGGHGFMKAEHNAIKIERSKRIIDLALAMGTNIVTTHIGVVPADKNSETYKIMQEACNSLAEYANGLDAFFAIETGPEPAAVLADFLDSLGSKGLAVNFDPANLVMVTGEDPIAAVYALKDYIVHTHAKDGRMHKYIGGEAIYGFFAEGGIGDLRLEDYFVELPLGEGDVNFDALLGAFKATGYNGFLTIEREAGNDPLKEIGMAVNFLKNHPLYK